MLKHPAEQEVGAGALPGGGAGASVPVPPELAQLRVEARIEDAGSAASAPASAPGAGAAPIAPAVETAEEWQESIEFMVTEFLVPMYPGMAKVYTAERIERLAIRLHAVAAKRGWSMAGFLTEWKEEIALGMAAVPLVRETFRELRAGRAARAAAPGDASSSSAGEAGAAVDAAAQPQKAGTLKFAQ